MTHPGRPWSLKRRLIVRMSVLAALAILGPLAFTLFHARGQIDDLREMALQEQASVVERAVIRAAGAAPSVSPTLLAAYRQGGEDYLFVVRDRLGAVVASSSPTAEALLHGAARQDGRLFLVAPVSGGSWLGYAKHVGDLQILVAQDQLHEDVLADSIAWDFAEASLWLTLPLLLAVLAVVYLTLTLMFRRVDRVAAAASALAPGQGAVPLSLEGLPREVAGLVQAVNLALERLSQAYETEKRFTADAAHELRTPLAILTSRVEALHASAERNALQEDVARMNRVVEQLLQAARLDAKPLGRGALDLGPLLLATVAEIAPLAVRQGREITLDVPPDAPIRVFGDASGLATVITNLIDNALRHTREGPIEIVATPAGVVQVLDRGEGVPDEEKRLLFERFQRGRRPVGSGSGLGLAIVRQIIEQLGGTVAVADRAGGGSVFTVHLKLAEPSSASAGSTGFL